MTNGHRVNVARGTEHGEIHAAAAGGGSGLGDIRLLHQIQALRLGALQTLPQCAGAGRAVPFETLFLGDSSLLMGRFLGLLGSIHIINWMRACFA